MILEESINKLIRDSIDLILESPGFAIRAKQKNAPRPEGSYADVDFISDSILGWEQFQSADQPSGTKIDVTSQSTRRIMISVGFYRDSSTDNARKVHQAILRESISYIFNVAGIAVIERSEVRHIPESFENTWEDRAQFDIFISAVGTDEYIVESIGSVNIPGQLQSGGFITNFNIEVP
tara:strand:+ start:399 stop:935 length:537 start_codon:yes stop_codon:yes gene_type:complete